MQISGSFPIPTGQCVTGLRPRASGMGTRLLTPVACFGFGRLLHIKCVSIKLSPLSLGSEFEVRATLLATTEIREFKCMQLAFLI